jgi:integration host factor subunit beta
MISKSVLARQICEELHGLTKKEVTIVLNSIFQNMKEALARGEKIEVRGFGIFKLRDRIGRIARNPKTGERVAVPARKTVHFKVSKSFHNELNGK